jgi:hypothetical protein
VFTPTGGTLLEVPGDTPQDVTLIGSQLFVNDSKSSAFPVWQPYDLQTGAKGKACDFNMANYLGTDGSVIVFDVA